jgi:TPP-dependent pyruvate/acetoin dehydrogenase alpha subunit
MSSISGRKTLAQNLIVLSQSIVEAPMSLSISTTMRSFPLSTQLGGTSQLKPKSAEEEFLEIAKKSPLERLRDKILEDMKTSEADLAQMEPEARTTVEDEIKRRMLEALQGSTEAGAVLDKTA